MSDSNKLKSSLAESILIMARLRAPDGCPWDLAQTFDSIKRHTLEETYEVFDAIERRAWPDLMDELGDLLLQVLFYAQIATDQGYFTIDDVAANLNAKLIRRHPHIFADTPAKTPEEVKKIWDLVKQQERAVATSAPHGLLDDVSRHQPAFLEAAKLGKKAASVGFDWPDTKGLIEKLQEETEELAAELRVKEIDLQRAEEEVGDILFTAVNLARHLKLEPEFVLRSANAKFRSRFAAIEEAAGGSETLKTLSAEQLDGLWRDAKAKGLGT